MENEIIKKNKLMNINEEKHEIREEILVYDDLVGECNHTWRIVDGEGIEECILCGSERDIFIDLSKLIYLRNHRE